MCIYIYIYTCIYRYIYTLHSTCMMILMWFNCVMILVLWHMQLSYELEIKSKLEKKNNKSHMDEGQS